MAGQCGGGSGFCWLRVYDAINSGVGLAVHIKNATKESERQKARTNPDDQYAHNDPESTSTMRAMANQTCAGSVGLLSWLGF